MKLKSQLDEELIAGLELNLADYREWVRRLVKAGNIMSKGPFVTATSFDDWRAAKEWPRRKR